jgi:hypothetical protein
VKNKMTDLRDHLFAALEGLADDDKPLDLDRARAIAEVAQTIVNSAKVEVDYCRITGRQPPTPFLEPQPPRLVATA